MEDSVHPQTVEIEDCHLLLTGFNNQANWHQKRKTRVTSRIICFTLQILSFSCMYLTFSALLLYQRMLFLNAFNKHGTNRDVPVSILFTSMRLITKKYMTKLFFFLLFVPCSDTTIQSAYDLQSYVLS